MSDDRAMSRRGFVGTCAAAALVGLSCKGAPRIAGGFIDDGGAAGHRLRGGTPPGPVRERVPVPVVIVGAGIAGLSAAWWLGRNGFHDYVVLELEDDAGGNTRSGRNDVSAYPWGAHYIPVPNKETTLVRELLTELGVLRDGKWDERALCYSPQERLYFRDRWHDGFEPFLTDTRDGRSEWARFSAHLAELRATGQFTIPIARGVPIDSPLDAMTMTEWLDREHYRSAALRWYADYACRDDYGARAAETSAWAGLHYFAAREHNEQGPLTWPEGNGWIVARLLERIGSRVRTRAPVRRIEPRATGAVVRTEDGEFTCDAVIFAAPMFLAPRVVAGFTTPVDIAYSPWLVANLTLERWPEEHGSPPAWDNTLVDSPGLGYVVSTHQQVATHTERTVWTYYRSLASQPAPRARAELAARGWGSWVDAILDDLGRAHPDVARCVSRIDIRRTGHAMARPAPGFLSVPWRRQLAGSRGPVFYGHADLSGMSIFEEAQYRGVEAARAVLHRIGRA